MNYTIVDGRVASCTPCFIGALPAELSLLAGGTLLLVLAVFAEKLQWLLVDPTPAALR